MDKIATKCEEHFIAAIALVYFSFLDPYFFLNILLGRENHSKTWASSTYVGSSKCLESLRLLLIHGLKAGSQVLENLLEAFQVEIPSPAHTCTQLLI